MMGLLFLVCAGVAGAQATRHRHPALHAGRRAVSAAAGNRSAWIAPALRDPQTIALSDATRTLALPRNRDYVLVCPPRRLSLSHALSVWGGHDVELSNCDIHVTRRDWAAHFKDQSGTLWIDDVHFAGAHLTGGVQLQEPGATVVMRDVLFDTVHGSYRTNHAECLQTWSGPARLLIDGLTCATTYQGLFLLPNQWDSRTRESTWDLRNIDISATGAYALWLGNAQPSNRGRIAGWHLHDVYVSGRGEPRDWDGTSDRGAAWAGVLYGGPPGGHFVSALAGGAVGADDATAPVALDTER